MMVTDQQKAPRPKRASHQRAVYDAIEAGGETYAQIRKLLRATDDAHIAKTMTAKQTYKAIDNLLYKGVVTKVNGKFMIASFDHFAGKNNVSQPAPKKKILLSDIMIKKSWLTHVLTAALAGAAGVSAGLVL